ncbi:hypothetical protein Poly30_31270 [Planctomycetes bacterium Poly30]|uniref:DUF4340 domain-containing protein n=1 Tax=Saltatorellus ferox TaxID=2528018 RepID=A0A518EU36_9BACT|nr:hypothetical protein Poly30_31270 [Planctomycetes bacterium Poly30]
MKQSTIKFLAGATVVVAVGAFAASKLRSRETAATMADEPVLPVLQDRVNDVTSVLIESKDGSLTLERGSEGWMLAEKNGYEANATKVRELILALREARVVEEKTANKERFDRLGLDDITVADSTSKRVTLKDDKGETIAALLIGDQRFAKGGAAPAANPNVQPGQQYYLHPAGDGPALLATGELRIDARPVGWIEQQFLDIGRDRIQAARVIHPDGTTVEAARAEMSDAEMQPLGVPEGMQAKKLNGTRPFLDALARLRFDDVKKEDQVDWEASEITTAEFFTEHGLMAKVETVEIPNEDAKLDEEGNPLPGQSKVWARFEFQMADEASKPSMPEQEADPNPEEPEGDATSTEEDAPEPEKEGPTAAEQAKELAKLQAKTKGWAYALPSWKSSAFRLKPDALFEEIPVPELPDALKPAAEDPTTILDDKND